MYATVLPTLDLRQLAEPRRDGLRRATGGAQHFYRYGRDALYTGLEASGLGAGDVALMPASMCDVVLMAFVKRGIALRFYDLLPSLAVPVAALESLVCSRTRAVYVNHYFGLETDFSAVADFCRARNLSLIEDCAHLLPGPQSRAGSCGDFAIFSPRKMLPIPDGGALRWNSAGPLPLEPVATASGAKGLVKLLAGQMALKGLLPVATIKKHRRAIEDFLAATPDFSVADWQAPTTISFQARAVADRCDVLAAIEARHENYRAAAQWAASHDGLAAFAPSAPVGAAPFSFPLLVRRDRDGFIRRAAARGLYLEPTFNAPYRDVPGLENPAAELATCQSLSEKLVSVPIHQAIEPTRMQKLLALLDAAVHEKPMKRKIEG